MTKARNIANIASDGSALADGTINYTDVSGTPTLATVATSGSFKDLSNQPAAFDPNTLAAVAVSGAYADVTGTPTLATVATTGAYADVTGTPAIPAPAFNPVSVSGATQALNVGSYNFFNANDLTVDTTLSFTSVPTDALWTYTAKVTLYEAYLIEDASYSGLKISVVPQGNNSPNGVAFNSDGTKMYVNGTATSLIYQYTLSRAFTVSTATYDSVSFSLSSQGNDHNSVVFSPDGTKMYSAGGGSNRVYQYTLSTAWDLSTAAYASLSKLISNEQGALFGLAFSSDGTKMYISGYSPTRISQYTLSTAWNIGTASYSSIYKDVNGYPMAIAFNSTGTKMIMLNYNNNKVDEYILSTAWNISTATYTNFAPTTDVIGGNVRGMAFSTDGSKMYLASNGSSSIYQYDTGIGYTITTPAAVQNKPMSPFRPDNQVTYTFVTNDGGTTVKLIGEEIT